MLFVFAKVFQIKVFFFFTLLEIFSTRYCAATAADQERNLKLSRTQVFLVLVLFDDIEELVYTILSIFHSVGVPSLRNAFTIWIPTAHFAGDLVPIKTGEGQTYGFINFPKASREMRRILRPSNNDILSSGNH